MPAPRVELGTYWLQISCSTNRDMPAFYLLTATYSHSLTVSAAMGSSTGSKSVRIHQLLLLSSTTSPEAAGAHFTHLNQRRNQWCQIRIPQIPLFPHLISQLLINQQGFYVEIGEHGRRMACLSEKSSPWIWVVCGDIECLLFPKAFIRIGQFGLILMSAYGHKRTFVAAIS